MRATVGRDRHRGRYMEIVQDGRASTLRTAGAASAGVGAGLGAGVVAEYLLDPDRGRTRRARIRDQAAHTVRQANRSVEVAARDMSNRGRGLAARARHRSRGGAVDDRVVHERVRSTLGRYVSHPQAVDVHVEHGIVTLSGDVVRGEDGRARRALFKIPGVAGVEARWNVYEDTRGVPGLQGGKHRQPVPDPLQQHWSPTTRVLAGSGAAALWVASRRMPRPVAWTARATGSVLAARAATNTPLKRLTGVMAGRRAVDLKGAVTVGAPPDRVWPLVSDYTIFAMIMPDIVEVRRSDDGRSHWVVTGPAGTLVRYDAEETRREENREIAWRTTEGEIVAHAGSLRLEPENENRTRVDVQMTYNPIAGALGHAITSALGANPSRKLKRALQRLESVVETQAQPAEPPPRGW